GRRLKLALQMRNGGRERPRRISVLRTTTLAVHPLHYLLTREGVIVVHQQGSERRLAEEPAQVDRLGSSKGRDFAEDLKANFVRHVRNLPQSRHSRKALARFL